MENVMIHIRFNDFQEVLFMRTITSLAIILMLLHASPFIQAKVPKYTVNENGVHIQGIDDSNPILYDNDWWMDIFDAYYLWAQTSLGKARLRGNIVTRDMWDHPKYQYSMQDCIQNGEKALELARKSGFDNIPNLTLGADQALQRPESGKIEDTKATASPGTELIIREARLASPEKPLVIFVGGPLTTVANALLLEPEIGENMVVFTLTVSEYGYNGKDGWSVYVTAKRTYLVDWGMGKFWDRNSVLRPEHFKDIPKSPIGDEMRRFIQTDLGQANQMGDGSATVWFYNNRCWRGVEERGVEYKGPATVLPKREPSEVLGIPKEKSDLEEMRKEFFRVMNDPRVYENE